MEERRVADNKHGIKSLKSKLVEDEEEFRSCYEEEEELKDREDCPKVDFKGNLDLEEDHATLYFKGVSVAGPGDSGCWISGIGVVIERPGNPYPLQVQKKLDFYVEEMVAQYLALLDGLSVVMQNNVRRVSVLTDSQIMLNQLTNDDDDDVVVESPLVEALRQRIREQLTDMEAFSLKIVPAAELEKALLLARVAVGIISTPSEGDELVQICLICGQEKLSSMMLTIKCSHKFCSHCLKSYVDRKLQSAQLPIICPQSGSGCKHCISASECRPFLTVAAYGSLEKALAEAKLICCPYSSCSALIDPQGCCSTRATSSTQSDGGCVECPACQQFICLDCRLPWHSSLSCEEYQSLPAEGRATCDFTLHHLAQNKRWRRCQHCLRMVELANGCYHMRCWCGREFCYSCGSEYVDGRQTCECALWDEDYSVDFSSYPPQNLEQWAWDSFESLPVMMDAYSDEERSQLALIQRFLAGGFSLSDNDSHQPPPPYYTHRDSYAETMKDLHQLPWLERFVSVITDDYYEDYVQ